MNRQEFILALREELSKLPPEEIVDATQYFEECFDEATDGLDEEARIAEEERLAAEFGSPKRIASQIRADYAARILDADEPAGGEKPGAKKKISAVWWVILGICSAPIAIPMAICVFTMVFCIYIAIIACFFGGLAAVVTGIASLARSVAGGITLTGIGLMLVGGSAAMGYGAFVGTKEIVKAIAKSTKKNREKQNAGNTYEEPAAGSTADQAAGSAAENAAENAAGSAAEHAAEDAAGGAGAADPSEIVFEQEVE